MSSKLVSSLAKVYDHKATLGRAKPGNMAGDEEDQHAHKFNLIQVKIESLSEKMDKLIHLQGRVLYRLDGMSQEIGDIEQDVETLMVDKEEVWVPPPPPRPLEQAGTNQVKEMCREMTTIMTAVNQRSEQQAKKLDGMEMLMLSIQEVISFIGETVKGSQLMELLFKRGSSSSREEAASPPPKEKAKDKGKETAERRGSADKGESVLSKKLDKLKDQKSIEGKEKPRLSLKSLKSQKKPPDSSDTSSLKKQPLLEKEVQKLNQQNAERSDCLQTTASQGLETRGEVAVPQAPQKGQECLDRLNVILDIPQAPAAKQDEDTKVEGLKVEEEDVEVVSKFEGEGKVKKEEKVKIPKMGKVKEEAKEKVKEANVTPADSVGPSVRCETPKTQIPHPADASASSTAMPKDVDPMLERKDKSKSAPSAPCEAEPDHCSEVTRSSGGQVAERVAAQVAAQLPEPEDHKQGSRLEEAKKEGVEEGGKEAEEGGEMGGKQAGGETEGGEPQEEEAEEAGETDEMGLDLEEWKKLWLQKKAELEGMQCHSEGEETKFNIDVSHPPTAPFNHRIVSAKPNQISNFYTINKEEMLGGGRFGQVHKCVENSSGLTLAAKIIKARSPKEKEVVKNEIQVMNQLDHSTLIQLYAAYESRYDIILVLEYVDGGELFDRIIDENYKLTELDSVHFIRQICEGVQHMHKMSIVHLDLKPENIMCVSRVTSKIKIIDFGLARVYKPREKLKVSFGTPEFLAPEVVNYEFVSFRTDMWSLGVITYMLLSSLSPFLGEDDNETMNNILACQWGFEEEEFTDISEEAKDFISKLLVLNKSWRLNSSEALDHDWLSDPGLHYRLHRKKNMCHSRRSSCIPLTD
ncbi:myosin light chain kinase 2, skeletal/cardiac muscle isoform X1 [Anguilla rostrata]|uniref:myosin light chain kinase 2, skeletal/cardiac muscle isoform X1 n=1 Tax=Anguilla rostrata TaxID=7938 RepID=UPI0030D20A18